MKNYFFWHNTWMDKGEVLEELKGGDSIIVSELSRLGRSMLECM